MFNFFAPCPHGLEGCLAQELQAQQARDIQTMPGGVRFRGTLETAYRANLHSRIASRVLLQLVVAPYRTEDDVYQLARRIRWLDWFAPDTTLRVDVIGRHCGLQSLDFITLRIKDAICDYYREETGQRPDVDTRHPKMHVQAFLDAEQCSVYLDFSGEPLFKRGWRQEKGEAPLRENLAAGILLLTGWTPDQTLLDPMCGSGTFAIEAAQMALCIAPGSQRHFAFEAMRNFDAAAWEKIRAQALSEHEKAAKHRARVKIFSSDISLSMVPIVRANLTRALGEYADCVQVRQIDALDLKKPAETGVLVCNPPYGERLQAQGRQRAAKRAVAPAPETFFKALADGLKREFSGWCAYFLSNDPALPTHMRLKASKRTPLFNGALECRLFEFRMVAGSNRKPPTQG